MRRVLKIEKQEGKAGAEKEHEQKQKETNKDHVISDKTVAPRGALRAGRHVVDVVAQGNKQVEEELGAAVEHLQLHGAAALEGGAAADDEGEVVGAQLGVGVGCVGVGVAGRRQDGAALDARLEPLLPQRHALQLLQPVPLRRAVDDRVLEEGPAGVLVVDGGLDGPAAAGVRGRLLDLPRVPPLVVQEAGVVVALVEVLEDGGKDLGGLVREGDAPGGVHVWAALQRVGEVGRVAQDMLMGGEYAVLVTDDESYNGTDTTKKDLSENIH